MWVVKALKAGERIERNKWWGTYQGAYPSKTRKTAQDYADAWNREGHITTPIGKCDGPDYTDDLWIVVFEPKNEWGEISP